MHAHCAIICLKSAFFNAACSGVFKESRLGTISLPEIQPDPMRAVLSWMYGYRYQLPKKDSRLANMELVVDTYVAADFLGIGELKKAITNSICIDFTGRFEKEETLGGSVDEHLRLFQMIFEAIPEGERSELMPVAVTLTGCSSHKEMRDWLLNRTRTSFEALMGYAQLNWAFGRRVARDDFLSEFADEGLRCFHCGHC
ncbi:hypothetical protein ABW19_dt0204329 [Dactylella cylindrospora]|nr:hypothetical protein ABW19_dt0204329 [Dactylella cylindrospora]